jgi:hypothetical protein
MANAARVFFWGPPIHGCEQKALQLFNEVSQFYAQKIEKGEIESADAVVFDHFSGELDGLMILRGDRDTLDKILHSDEAVGFGHRSELLLTNCRIATGFAGESLRGRMASFAKQVTDLFK